MKNTLFRLGVTSTVTLLAMLPGAALAYLSPQDVFDPGQGSTADTSSLIETTRFDNRVQAPPTQREGEAVIQAQQQKAAALRDQAQATGLKSIDAEPVDTYVPVTTPPPSRLDPNVNYEIRQQRMSEARANSPTVVIAAPGVRVDSNGRVLHSGAPYVSSTGPETTLTLGALLLAGISTLGWSVVQSRKASSATDAL